MVYNINTYDLGNNKVLNKIYSWTKKSQKTVITKSSRDLLVQRKVKIRNYLPIFIVLLSVILVSAGTYYLFKTNMNKAEKLACINSNRQLLSEASRNFAPEKSNELKKTIDKIQSLHSYQKDPNCLNVLTIYYINVTDSKNARESFDKLTKVYNQNDGFAPELQMVGGKNIEQLRGGVEYVEKLKLEFERNTFHGPAV